MELEKLHVQNQCLLLKSEVREKEEKLRLQREEHQKQDAVRIQIMKDLKSDTKYWAEKCQSLEFTSQLTQEDLEALTTKNRGKTSGINTQAKTGNMESGIKMTKIAAQRDK